jgi:hypothetical protein
MQASMSFIRSGTIGSAHDGPAADTAPREFKVTLEPIASTAPWALATVLGLAVVCKCIVAIGAIRGAESKDRAAIIKAVADLFGWWRR